MGKKAVCFWGVLLVFIIVVFVVITFLMYNQKKEQIIATIGDEKFTEAQLNQEMKKNYGKEVLNNYINQKVVFKAAEKYNITVSSIDIEREYNRLKEGYESDSDSNTTNVFVKDQTGSTKEELLENIRFYLLWEDLATKDIVIPEKELKDYYDLHREQFSDAEKVHLQQIIVNSKKEAEQVIQELKEGSDFNTLAQEKSIDILTASKGGDLGFISLNDIALPREIINKAKSLKIGEFSDPIQVDGGYEVIKVLERRDKKDYPYDEVKNEIRRSLALSQVNPLPKALEQLKREMGVVVLDSSLR